MNIFHRVYKAMFGPVVESGPAVHSVGSIGIPEPGPFLATWVYGPGWYKYQGPAGQGLGIGAKYWVKYGGLGVYQIYEYKPTVGTIDTLMAQKSYNLPAEHNRDWERCEG